MSSVPEAESNNLDSLIDFESWVKACKLIFDHPKNSLKSYIQTAPFANLSKNQKDKLRSVDFFNSWIRDFQWILNEPLSSSACTYVLTDNGSLRKLTLV